MKRVTSLLLVLCSLFVFFLVGCGSKTEEEVTTTTAEEATTTVAEEAQITDGLFLYSFSVDGRSFNFYIHFYENGIFYFSGLGGAQILVGRYEVVDEEWSGQYFKNRDDAASPEDPKPYTQGTAPKTINFFNLSGAEIGESGYDPDLGNIYNVNMEGQPGYCAELLFVQDVTAEPNATIGAENGVALYKYELVNEDGSIDTASYVEINHNGTYTDMIEYQISGSWELNDNVYALTPEDSSDTPATLTLSEDGKTATYLPKDGTAVTLKLYEEALVVAHSFVGEVTIQTGVNATFTIYLYTNGSADGKLMMGERELASVSGGRWSENEDGIQTISLGGESYSAPAEGADVTAKTIVDGKFQYTGTFSSNGNEMTLTIDMELVPEGPEALLTAESGSDSIVFYDDFTFKATAYSGQAAIEGTWEMPSYTLVLALTGKAAAAMTIEATMDSSTYAITVSIKRGDSVAVSFELARGDWGTALQGKAPAPEALLTAESGSDSIVFYDDFTFKATAYSGQAAIEGTWEMPSYTLVLALTGQAAAAMTIEATMDSTSHNYTVSIKRGDSVAVSFELAAADWGTILQGKAPAA
ncbi:MAG: hypothetical protein K6G38_01665 [Gammaproteobacteria bacterium]|nr:hypothetical protein [Gammaproteobacteria bacterium]